MSIFIGGSLDGETVPQGTSGDFKNKKELYLLRQYWKRDGIGGTVHARIFWVFSEISNKDAVFKIERYLRITPC